MGSVSLPVKDVLETALADLHQQYIKKNQLSKANHDEACRYMPGGNTRTVLHTQPFTPVFRSGESCYLHTADGDVLIDFLNEYTAAIYGHNHPVIRKAVESTVDRGWNYGGHSGLEAKLAQIVCTRFPVMERIRFVNSGTEANMMALATATAVTGKKKILIFNKGYHGSTISTQLAPGKLSINLPHEFVMGTFNDVDGTKDLVQSLPKDSLAAILVEPMLGSGGCFPATKDFLATLRALATEHKAVLIFDEVMTSRLAPQGLGHAMGVTPDLMTVGKWIGGGMSFGAFGGRKELMDLYDPRTGKIDHPGTFNNNVFTMSAGIAGCNLMTADVINKLNALGDTLRENLVQVLRKYDILTGTVPSTPIPDNSHDDPAQARRYPKMFVTGRGSMLTVHFTGPERMLWQGLFFHHMFARGIYVAPRGFIALSIELKQEHVDTFIDVLEGFVTQWEAELKW